MEPPLRPVLEYARPDERDPIPYLRAMRVWRHVAGWGFWMSIAGLLFYPVLAVVAFLVLCVASLMTLVFMFRAATREAGVGYGVRQLLLAIVLLPVLFAGVFLVTRLVEADLVRWWLAERRENQG